MKHDIKELLFNMFGYTDVDLLSKNWIAIRLKEASEDIEKLIKKNYLIKKK